jgi:molybdenum cofactor cytidylyltransferase
MIGWCIEGMKEVCDRIIVVGGNEFGKLHSLLEGIPKVECVENVSWQKGMFTSVKAGLALVRGDRCFVIPGDIPLVPPSVYRALLESESEIVIPSFQGRNGHPVCCSRAVIPRILGEPDESSFRDVIRAIGFHTLHVDAEEILIDVDTFDDYESVRRRFA